MKLSESKYIVTKQLPTQQRSYIELSPKGKQRKRREGEEQDNKLKVENHGKVNENSKKNWWKENRPSNT
jgi:DNA-binding PadR family transcriptional regulator